MARNVNETEADEATQGGSIMERDAFLDVLATVSAAKGKISKLTGNVSALLNKAENDHNMDKKAFAIVQWARRQEPTRVNAFLRHFDAYREYADLDAMAGSDMFEGPTAGAGNASDSDNVDWATERAIPKAAKPKGSRKPKAGPKPGKAGKKPKKGQLEIPEGPEATMSAVEAAANAWGLTPEAETHGAA